MASEKSKIEKKALQALQKQNYKKAATEYEKIIGIDANDIRARAKLLDLYLRLGKHEKAIEECTIVSDYYLEQGFIPRSVAAWTKTARVINNNPDIYKNLGELYLKQKLVGDALGAFQRAAAILRKSGNDDEAGSILLRMEELAPKNPMIKLLLAEHYLMQEKFEEFDNHLQNAINQLKELGRIQKLLSSLESLYGKYERPEIIRPLADLYVNMGEHDKALEFIAAGLLILPGDRDLRLDAISANVALGNPDEAGKMARELYEENPSDIFIMEQLAFFAEGREDLDEQIEWYKKLATVCREQGQEVKAGQYERKIKELAPKEAEETFAFEGGELEDAFDTLVIAEDESPDISATGPLAADESADSIKEAEL